MTEKAAFAHHYLAFANATATFTLPKDITIEGQYSGTSRLYSGNSEVAPRHIVSLFARKKLAGNHFLITRTYLQSDTDLELQQRQESKEADNRTGRKL